MAPEAPSDPRSDPFVAGGTAVVAFGVTIFAGLAVLVAGLTVLVVGLLARSQDGRHRRLLVLTGAAITAGAGLYLFGGVLLALLLGAPPRSGSGVGP